MGINAEHYDVVIADKSPLVIKGLRELFAADDRFGRIAHTAAGDDLMDLVAQENFAVAVIGWILGAGSGREVLELSARRVSTPPVLVYTGDPDPSIPRTVMSLGGAGFCSKTESPAHLIEMVVQVARGQMVFPFVDVNELTDDRLSSLTARELAIVAALADGASNRLLADQFGVTVNTVKFHLRNAYAKLGARNRAQAVAMFLQSESAV